MTISKTISTFDGGYTMNNTELERVRSYNDLGVTTSLGTIISKVKLKKLT